MKLSSPEPLNKRHFLDAFDSDKPVLDNWLKKHARQAQSGGSAKTFVVCDEDKAAVGFFSLTVGQVDTFDVPDRVRKGMGQYPIPVVILARLAVSRHYQGKGIGRGLLQDAIWRTFIIAEQAGIRAILTHPIDSNATEFYQKFGFKPSPLTPNQLVLLIKDAKKLQR